MDLALLDQRLLKILSNEKHDVRVMDNSETYGVITNENLKKLYKYRQRNWKKVHLFNGDVSNRDNVLKAFYSRPDIVIHLASYPRAKIVNAGPNVRYQKYYRRYCKFIMAL